MAGLVDVEALKVHQWLPQWDAVEWDAKQHRRKPPKYFYLFSLPAHDVRRLAGIYRRSTAQGQARLRDTGIQRYHEQERSDQIAQYVKYGYPLSSLTRADPDDRAYADLRKPGWLSTAVVVNIVGTGERRDGRTMDDQDIIRIRDTTLGTRLRLPPGFRRTAWKPTVRPLEVIDGQHRLWAFVGRDTDREFEIPVVAFDNLDLSWQAYLFWSINITPKRISPSLAYDLYPLLRTEDWLERYGGERVYRETRAQELVEALWSHPDSPWKNRIAMLGDRAEKKGITGQVVSQASWVRALVGTFIRSWNNASGIGGLFGSAVGTDRLVLPWDRAQQAAVVLYVWQTLADEVARDRSSTWAKALRKGHKKDSLEPAFWGDGALLSTDQGIRGVLFAANDLLYKSADALDLRDWDVSAERAATDVRAVTNAIESLKDTEIGRFIRSLARGLVKFDWRTSSAPGLSDSDRRARAALRGSGGYREIRAMLADLLRHEPGPIGTAAKEVARALAKEP